MKKLKNAMKGIVGAVLYKVAMLAILLVSGPAALMAQNTAGDYTAGTNALTTVAEEIAKYVPIMVKLCYAIAGVVAIVGAISVYIAMNKRRAGCQEENHDGRGRLHLPDCGGTGTSAVFRYRRLKRRRDERQGRTLSGLPVVQGASAAS